MKKIKAIVKRPGAPAELTEISNTLEAFQTIVNGYIESVQIASNMTVICNEEGRILGMPYNCEIAGIGFVGPVAVVGTRGEQFVNVPETLEIFNKYWLGGNE